MKVLEVSKSLYDKYLNLLIDEEVPLFLQKYLNVSSLVRLKNICYFCGMGYVPNHIYDFKEKISRYDHSLTVSLLTWKFTKDKKMTISGLFHDIATPCFSHVIDYMNKDYQNQESTEQYTEKIIKEDKLLLKYLKDDGLLPEDIIDFKKYSIVDNNRPKLCADRLDGIILAGMAWIKKLNENDLFDIISDLTIYQNEDSENELGFKTQSIALNVLNISNEIDKYCHTNEDNFMMELLAEITKISIKYKIVKYNELYYIDEPTLLNKIRNSNIDEINKLLYKFENIIADDIPIVVLKGVKVRNLDPLVNGYRLSNLK